MSFLSQARAWAASFALLALTACGGGESASLDASTRADTIRKASVAVGDVGLRIPATVRIKTWKMSEHGWCPDSEWSVNVEAADSNAVLDAYIKASKAVCNGALEKYDTKVTRTESPISGLVGDVFIEGGATSYVHADVDWFGDGSRVTSEAGAPFGTISCPVGYVFESPYAAEMINGGLFPLIGVSYGCVPDDPSKVLPAKNLGQPDHCPVLDPVDPATGNEFRQDVDLALATPTGLSVVRFYNSDVAAGTGLFGAHWSTVFDRQLVQASNVLGHREAIRPDGRRIGFIFRGDRDGMWETQSDVRDRLQQLSDSSGRVTGWRYVSAPDDEIETYDLNGRLVSVSNRAGQKSSFSYAEGRLLKATDPFGRSLSFSYGSNGFVSQVTDALKRVYVYGYDVNGNLLSVTYPDGKKRRYVYDEAAMTGGVSRPHALTGVFDEADQRISTVSYDSKGRASATESAGGAGRGRITYEQNAVGTITKATVTVGDAAPTEHVVTVESGRAQITKTTAPCWASGSASTTTKYPYLGVAGDRTDLNGVQTQFAFDERQNETRRLEAVGKVEQRETRTQWHSSYRLPIRITRSGQDPSTMRSTDLDYDAAGSLISRTERATGKARTWSYAYDLRGLLVAVDGPRTDVADATALSYDSVGNLASITNALGHITRFDSYDALGHLLQMTDANGRISRYAYDARDRLVNIVNGSETTSISYTEFGALRNVTLPSGASYTYSYDPAQRLIRIADAEGSHLDFSLDTAGNRIKEEVRDGSGRVLQSRSREFDAMNRMVKAIGALGQTTALSYDGNGNLVRIDDPLHNVTARGVDALNRIQSITDAALGVTNLIRNPHDQVTQVQDPMKYTSRMSIDALGDVAYQALPAADGDFFDASYDAAGNLLKKTNALVTVESYAYDALNRVVSVSAPGAVTISYGYDEGANGRGHLTSMRDAAGLTRWTYDAQGRVESESRDVGGLSLTLRYGRGPGGQITQITYPSGRTVNYAYARGLLSSVSVDGAPLLNGVQSTPWGAYSGWTWASGLAYQRGFDTDGRINRYSMGAGFQSLTYDFAGRLVAISDSSKSTFNQRISYDVLDRVTAYSGPTISRSGNERYVYDGNGNRTSLGVGSQSFNYSYDVGSNTLIDAPNPTPETVTDLQWDPFLRVAGVTSAAAGLVTYAVDGLGRRMHKASRSGTTHFVYGPTGELLAELDGAGRTTMEYVWLPSQESLTGSGSVPQPVAVSRGSRGALNYVFADHLNTPRLVTSASGSPLWRWTSDPFGNTAPLVSPGGFAINLRFAGQYFDAESGWHYNWHRYYDPRIGRYVQSDPIGLNGGLNTYSYVGANPLGYVDPTGLEKLIWVSPFRDATIFSGAVADPDRPGMMTIYAHGGPNAMNGPAIFGQYGESLNAIQAAELIRKSGWNRKDPIWLKSCNTGKDPNGFAQQLANALGVAVYAPNVQVWFNALGVVGPLPRVGQTNEADYSNPGQYSPFYPMSVAPKK